MREVRNKINRIKAENGVVSLPDFARLEDGSYAVLNEVEISQMSEIREYLKKYREISKLIRENYRKEIADIFHFALGELVGRADDDFVAQKVPVENLGGEFNDVQYFSRFAAGRGLSKKTIDRILSTDGLGVKRYKPGREIIDMMKMSDTTGYMVLPEMSEHGVVAVPDKNSKAIALRFKKFNGQDAAVIKDYLLSIADAVENGEYCKAQIEDIFDLSKQLSEVDVSLSGSEKSLISLLGQRAVELMGVDLTAFQKRRKTRVEPAVEDVFAGDDTHSGLGDNENYETNIAYDEQGNGTDMASGKITQIIVDGLNNFSQGMNNGKIQVLLSPSEGFYYTLEIDGDKLVAKQEPNQPTNE